jgi:Arc/MetJ family transcription regulator
MVKLKAAGASRYDLAKRYEVHPKTVNRLVGVYGRRDAALAQAANIEATEDHLEGRLTAIRNLHGLLG